MSSNAPSTRGPVNDRLRGREDRIRFAFGPVQSRHHGIDVLTVGLRMDAPGHSHPLRMEELVGDARDASAIVEGWRSNRPRHRVRADLLLFEDGEAPQLAAKAASLLTEMRVLLRFPPAAATPRFFALRTAGIRACLVRRAALRATPRLLASITDFTETSSPRSTSMPTRSFIAAACLSAATSAPRAAPWFGPAPQSAVVSTPQSST